MLSIRLNLSSSRLLLSRFFSVQLSPEVSAALKSHRPIVALESTIITHGLPYPQNLEMATAVEQEIRNMGCVPATTAFIKGIPKVGLSRAEIEGLAKDTNVRKVSRRDIPYIMAKKLNGGTTISGTMILSHKVGIKVFATGGLGGVHRDGENTMDISADLDELGRTPVAVVCAGPKSILDIELTMEYLETKGVFVGTLGPDGTNIPGFYSRDSGVKSVYNFETFREAAQIIEKGNSIDLGNGYLFCIPPPENIALDSDFINGVIDAANLEAKSKGIKGKDITPFLLSKIAKETKGASVNTNIQFVLNNARSASQISIELNKLFVPSSDVTPAQELKQSSETIKLDSLRATKKQHDEKSLIIGSVAVDSYVKMENVILKDSNPSKITSTFGGVGYNIALESYKAGNTSLKFISAVGTDIFGEKISRNLPFNSSLQKKEGYNTSQYISFHDSEGELVIAGADMGIIENISKEHVKEQISKSTPRYVLTDLNISKALVAELSLLSEELDFSLIIEPTSLPKSKKLSSIHSPIFLSTPTVAELHAIYDSFEDANKFELDFWFPVIDKLGVDGEFRNKLELALSKEHKHLFNQGIFQKGVSLLPFINNLIIKDGANGIYLLSLHSNISKIEINKRANFSYKSRGSHGFGILFEHYKPPEVVRDIQNVTGAGDTLLGVFLAELVNDPCLLETNRDIISRAQQAAVDRITG